MTLSGRRSFVVEEGAAITLVSRGRCIADRRKRDLARLRSPLEAGPGSSRASKGRLVPARASPRRASSGRSWLSARSLRRARPCTQAVSRHWARCTAISLDLELHAPPLVAVLVGAACGVDAWRAGLTAVVRKAMWIAVVVTVVVTVIDAVVAGWLPFVSCAVGPAPLVATGCWGMLRWKQLRTLNRQQPACRASLAVVLVHAVGRARGSRPSAGCAAPAARDRRERCWRRLAARRPLGDSAYARWALRSSSDALPRFRNRR